MIPKRRCGIWSAIERAGAPFTTPVSQLLMSRLPHAARGKRGKPAVAAFEHGAAGNLLAIQAALRNQTWRPGGCVHFQIHSPKQRRISAAHLLAASSTTPIFIADSFANRVGKGTHRAVDRLQHFSRRYRYAIRLDIVKHFHSSPYHRQ